jgi:hypothetical protein
MPLEHLVFIPGVFLVGALAGFVVAPRRTIAAPAHRPLAGTVRPVTVLATLGAFLIILLATHVAPIPGGLRALRASVNQQALFDQDPAFSPDEVARRIAAFGEAGREAYQRFTYTTDLVFPLGLFLFLYVLARFVGTRVALERVPRIILGIVPVLWLASDFAENATVSFLISTYPVRHPVPATVLAYVTVSKYTLLATSVLLPLVVFAASRRTAAEVAPA